VANIRKGLEKSEAEANKLNFLRHSHDYLLRLAIAQGAKERYLLGCSLFCSDGTPYWKDDEGWDTPDAFLTHIQIKLNKQTLSLKDIREIARTEPWASFWSMQKHCEKIFKVSPIELNDDQRTLVIWSSIYESIREHPDNLQDYVVEDDDMIDGWMIIKRKERESTHVSKETLTKNEKILRATEQFYMAPPGSLDPSAKFTTVEEVNDFLGKENTPEALDLLKQRTSVIKTRGEVKEAALPDVALQNKIAYNKALAEKSKAVSTVKQ
jgi:hypothetical protein